MFETLFLRLVHLCEVFENCFIRLSNDWNHFYETTDHSQQFRVDKFSTFFKSEAFTVKSNSFNFDWKRCNTFKGFYALFVYCICSKNDSVLSVFSKAGFLSSTFFLQIINKCRRVFHKTITLLGLAGYEMIITNSVLRTSLVIYHFISSASGIFTNFLHVVQMVTYCVYCAWSNIRIIVKGLLIIS